VSGYHGEGRNKQFPTRGDSVWGSAGILKGLRTYPATIYWEGKKKATEVLGLAIQLVRSNDS